VLRQLQAERIVRNASKPGKGGRSEKMVKRIFSRVMGVDGARAFTVVGFAVILALMLWIAATAPPATMSSNAAFAQYGGGGGGGGTGGGGGQKGCADQQQGVPVKGGGTGDKYWHAELQQSVDPSTTGASAKISQYAPYVQKDALEPIRDPVSFANVDEAHSLAQIAVVKTLEGGAGTTKQIDAIEVGWVVRPSNATSYKTCPNGYVTDKEILLGYGDNQPHLFVKPTRGDQWATATCWYPDWGGRYNKPGDPNSGIDWGAVERDCGWVQESTTWYPNLRDDPNRNDDNSTLAADGKAREFKVVFEKDRWRVYYDGKPIGHFPEKFWSAPPEQGGVNRFFTNFDSARWYGEVASDFEPPCTDMGNKKKGTEPGAAEFKDMKLTDSQGKENKANATIGRLTNPDYYNVGNNKTGDSFTYGGSGPC
jgi:hypothetical protein